MEYTTKEIKNRILTCFNTITYIDCKINKAIFLDKRESNIENNVLRNLKKYIELDYKYYKDKYNLTDEELRRDYYFLIDIKNNNYGSFIKLYLTLKF